MFTPWMTVSHWLKENLPRAPKLWTRIKPRFNFLTIHYTYLLLMTIIGSIILYPVHNMSYIDALFFASGAATQSGLNTIDVNKLALYQQIVIMLMASICNPIFINTFVVFIRLYWFEKRFQNVVLEARSMRRTRTRSRTKSEAKEDHEPDLGHEENGVGSRRIHVLRTNSGHAEGKRIEDESVFHEDQDDESGAGSSTTRTDEGAAENAPPKVNTTTSFRRDITFADEVSSPPDRLPEKNKEQSIAFVEKQRNPQENTTFRIPGPRDYDLGFVPQQVTAEERLATIATRDNDDDELQVKRQRSSSVPPTELNEDDHPLKQHITINVPTDMRRRPTTGPSAYNVRPRRGSDAGGSSSNIPTIRDRSRSRTFASFLTREREEDDPMPYLSWTPTVGRNSAFVDLTEEQREELGGIEYRALKLLALILVCYYVGFHLLGMICLLPWIVRSQPYSAIVEAVDVSPVWWGFFTPASLFNDLGFTLTPDSMISFQKAIFPLLLGTFLIIIGNTGFPCMLRFVIWLCCKCVPHRSGVWEELRFLLDHPRRCFTLLFPSQANWWLFWVLVLLNGVDLFFFIVLDLNDPAVTHLPVGFRFLDGLFQAASTRTAGFAVVNLADLHPAIQVSYLIMMYISVFPIAISLRKTNVYEEKSLGIYSSAEEEEAGSSYVSTHLRRQLSFDLWFVFLGFFIIAIVEGGRLENTKDVQFTLFSVLFEIVSAYGTVGLSLGYSGVNTSFSGQFKTLSKLVIIAMQLRGRHRGLPYALDRAILLPSESLHRKEDEDATRRARRNSMTTADTGMDGITRQGTGTSRRSSISGDRQGLRGRITGGDMGRFFGGVLGAGPTIPREKSIPREKKA